MLLFDVWHPKRYQNPRFWLHSGTTSIPDLSPPPGTSLTFVAFSSVASLIRIPGFVQDGVYAGVPRLAVLVVVVALACSGGRVRLLACVLAVANRVYCPHRHVWLTHELQHQVRIQFLVAASTVLICPLKRQVTLALFSALEEFLEVYKQQPHRFRRKWFTARSGNTRLSLMIWT